MTHRLQQSTLTAVQPNSISNTEVAAIAKAAIGSAWTIDGCTDFVWAVTGLAGAPFFDLAGAKKLVNGDPLMPEDTAAGFAVPHGSSPNQGGDGWSIVSHAATTASIIANLAVGDVVRAYRTATEQPTANDQFPGHEFIVTRKDASGTWWAVDNTHPGDHAIWEHPLNATWASWDYLTSQPGHVYISRLDPTFALPDDAEGNSMTTKSLSLDNGQVAGNIDRPGDADWFKVQLVQGKSYTFHLDSGSAPQVTPFLANPFLYLYDKDGRYLASDDDSGPGLNSQLTFTATYTGNFFLSARASGDNSTGSYRIWDPPATNVAGSISINDVSVIEGNSGTTSATFTVTRSGGTSAFNVNYATADGDATTSDADYVAKSGTLQFGANVNSQTITITINGDTKVEPNQDFFVNLTGATGGASIADSQGRGTIVSDDSSVNHAPVVTGQNVSVVAGQSIAASSMIASVHDQDGDSAVQYAFWDGGSGGGHFTINGTTQASGQWLYVTAANLGTIRYVGGATAGSESILLGVSDGKNWSQNGSLTATTTAAVALNHAPVITGQNVSVVAGQSIAASSMIASVHDQDGDSAVQYAFWDGGSGGGHFTINGTTQASGQWLYVTAANLGTIRYIGGATAGSETIILNVNDGRDWGQNASLMATTTAAMVNHAPVITGQNVSVVANQSIAASSMITSVTDQDGDGAVQYAFWDGGSGGGHFTINGTTQASGQWLYVAAANLGTIRYIGGSAAGSEAVYLSVSDGKDWSQNVGLTATTTATAAVNHAPVIAGQNVNVAAGQSISASSMIASVHDQDGDSAVQYAFWDGGSGGGHFTINGSTQASGQWLYVNAANLGTIRYVGGTSPGSEAIYLNVNDGKDWGQNASLTATTTANGSKVVSVPVTTLDTPATAIDAFEFPQATGQPHALQGQAADHIASHLWSSDADATSLADQTWDALIAADHLLQDQHNVLLHLHNFAAAAH